MLHSLENTTLKEVSTGLVENAFSRGKGASSSMQHLLCPFCFWKVEEFQQSNRLVPSLPYHNSSTPVMFSNDLTEEVDKYFRSSQQKTFVDNYLSAIAFRRSIINWMCKWITFVFACRMFSAKSIIKYHSVKNIKCTNNSLKLIKKQFDFQMVLYQGYQYSLNNEHINFKLHLRSLLISPAIQVHDTIQFEYIVI